MWTCKACTFENTNEQASRCEICETRRGDSLGAVCPMLSLQRLSTKPVVQKTLFGTAVETKEKTRKRKVDKISTAAQHQPPLISSFSPKPPPAAAAAAAPPHAEPSPRKRKADKTPPAPHQKQSQRSFFLQKALATVTDAPYRTVVDQARTVLRQVFQIESLRGLQPASIKCALKGKSQLLVMATGGGKSLCYQLPAIVLGGTTIVVSPLIALMNDQVAALLRKGIEAAVISSANGARHNTMVLERLLMQRLQRPKKASDDIKPLTILYCTPEQIQSPRFQNVLEQMYASKRLAQFAIDEAHCISSWGHDFRLAYSKLGWLRDRFPDVPLLACTATATAKVMQDIQNILKLQDSPKHIGSFDRPNIFYRVAYKDALDTTPGGARQHLAQQIQKWHKQAEKRSLEYSGIAYVHKREETTELASFISEATGIPALAYHAGMKADERARVQEAWTIGDAKVIVATISFGMGIDRKNVSFVVHFSMSKSVEEFYQVGPDAMGMRLAVCCTTL